MRDRIVPWFSAASRMQVMFLSASTPWTRADSSRLLTSRSSFSNRWSLAAISSLVGGPLPVHLQVDLVLLLQHRPELVLVEPLGVLEVDPHHVGERLVAVGHHVPQVAQRDHVAEPQRVPPIDQQLEHDLQGRPLPLEGAGDRHQRLDQRRAERVDHAGTSPGRPRGSAGPP